jgi:integrase
VQIDGRRIYLGKFGSPESHERYRRLVADWLRRQPATPSNAKPVVATRELSVNELLLAYWRFAETYYVKDGESTHELENLRAALKPLKHLYGLTPATEFGPLALKAVRQQMIDADLSRGVINNRVNRIRRVFKWGVSEELIPASVHHGLQAVAGLKKGRSQARETEPVRPVPEAHVDAVIPFVSAQVATMIRLQQLTGMRPGEVVFMRPCDLQQSGDVWLYTPERHKNAYRGHKRTIYLGPRAQTILRPYLARDPMTFCFSPAEAEAERNQRRRSNRRSPMTPSQARRRAKPNPKRAKKQRYDVPAYRRAISYGVKRADVPLWHPNQLRHSCGTEVRRVFGLDAAQLILGHKTLSMTQVYAEVDQGKAVEIVRAIG